MNGNRASTDISPWDPANLFPDLTGEELARVTAPLTDEEVATFAAAERAFDEKFKARPRTVPPAPARIPTTSRPGRVFIGTLAASAAAVAVSVACLWGPRAAAEPTESRPKPAFTQTTRGAGTTNQPPAEVQEYQVRRDDDDKLVGEWVAAEEDVSGALDRLSVPGTARTDAVLSPNAEAFHMVTVTARYEGGGGYGLVSHVGRFDGAGLPFVGTGVQVDLGLGREGQFVVKHYPEDATVTSFPFPEGFAPEEKHTLSVLVRPAGRYTVRLRQDAWDTQGWDLWYNMQSGEWEDWSRKPPTDPTTEERPLGKVAEVEEKTRDWPAGLAAEERAVSFTDPLFTVGEDRPGLLVRRWAGALTVDHIQVDKLPEWCDLDKAGPDKAGPDKAGPDKAGNVSSAVVTAVLAGGDPRKSTGDEDDPCVLAAAALRDSYATDGRRTHTLLRHDVTPLNLDAAWHEVKRLADGSTSDEKGSLVVCLTGHALPLDGTNYIFAGAGFDASDPHLIKERRALNIDQFVLKLGKLEKQFTLIAVVLDTDLLFHPDLSGQVQEVLHELRNGTPARNLAVVAATKGQVGEVTRQLAGPRLTRRWRSSFNSTMGWLSPDRGAKTRHMRPSDSRRQSRPVSSAGD